jgi:hypothetical protein
MKYLPIIASFLLCALFLMATVPFFLNIDMKGPPMAQDAMTFMTVFVTTGYLKFVKVFELLGAILVAIPRTRNLGLLILGPIIINILAFNFLVNHGENVIYWMIILICALPLYLLWVERKNWKGLIAR